MLDVAFFRVAKQRIGRLATTIHNIPTKMSMQEGAGKHTMEQLQYIIPKLSDLLKTPLEIMKFHQECSHLYPRMRYAIEILNVIKTGNLTPVNSADVYVDNLAKELTKIRYIPEEISRDEFLQKLPEDVQVSYNLYAWLLKNQEKVAIRAYLTDFVDPVYVPDQFITDEDVKKTLNNNKQLVELFWKVYKSFSTAEKGVAQTLELQSDLKAMYQDIGNLKKRTNAQKEQLQNISGSEFLVSLGRLFTENDRQRSKLLKEISVNAAIIKRMKRTISTHDRLTKFSNLNIDSLVTSLHDALNTSKTLLNASIKLEKDKVVKTKLLLDETIKGGVESKILIKQTKLLKMEIQDLTNQKVALHSAADDKLGAFRKQATGVANRKQVLSEKVNNIRNKHIQLTDQLKAKETKLYNVVGGEVYHGEKLKRFIAELRAKSVTYKNKRRKLQYWTAEVTLLNRTIDVLHSTDPSLKDIPQHPIKISQDESKSIATNSIEEAKQVVKKLIPEIEAERATTVHIQTALLSARKENSNILEKYELIKEQFAMATKTITTRLDKLKEEEQLKNDQIEILERNWKDTTRELEKLDQVYSQLVDDILEYRERESKGTYQGQLEETKNSLEKWLVDLEEALTLGELEKREALRKMKVYEDLHIILTKKLE